MFVILCLCYYFIDILPHLVFFFFFNDTATTEIYTLSLHDALPILLICSRSQCSVQGVAGRHQCNRLGLEIGKLPRSEEHTSELQSHLNLVCRLLLEKKKKTGDTRTFCFTIVDTIHYSLPSDS